MKNVIEQAVENNTEYKIAMFKAKQKESYEFKVRYAEIRAWLEEKRLENRVYIPRTRLEGGETPLS